MSRVFVNRTLNMKRIKYMGFDMDHTLVRYHVAQFEALAHRITLEKLVRDRSFPEAILEIPFEYDRISRGLVIDRKNGNFLKLSERGAIRLSYHGTKKIDYRDQRRFYKGTLIDLEDPNFIPVDTVFTISFGNLFAHLVDLKEGELKDALPSFEEIARAVWSCGDIAHGDGSIKDTVATDLPRFIKTDPTLIAALERYKRHGKTLFILTNSDYSYTKMLLDYTVTPYLKQASDWRELFEFVITDAKKPRFFFEQLQFYRFDSKTEEKKSFSGQFGAGIYEGGCVSALTAGLGIEGEEILYVGDHIYGDILRVKKDCAWRTALVIDELDAELGKTRAALPVREKIEALMVRKETFEGEFTRLEDIHIESGDEGQQERVDELRRSIAEINGQISPLIVEHQAVFNPFWGEVMRIGNEASFFAGQVERYACTYAATLKDLLSCSPRTYFRAARRPLPHEM